MQREGRDTEAKTHYEEALANCTKLLAESGVNDKRLRAL